MFTNSIYEQNPVGEHYGLTKLNSEEDRFSEYFTAKFL